MFTVTEFHLPSPKQYSTETRRAASHDSKPALTADMINHTIILIALTAEIIVKDLHLSRYHEYQCASFVGVR